MDKKYKTLIIISTLMCLLGCDHSSSYTALVVRSESMNPTYKKGEVLKIRKWNESNTEKNIRGMIVVVDGNKLNSIFVPPNTVLVRRIVGLPGEAISIIPPWVYVNGCKLMKPDIFSDIATGKNGGCGFVLPIDRGLPPIVAIKDSRSQLILGDREYFLLGDNGSESMDSRYFGAVREECFIGVSVGVK